MDPFTWFVIAVTMMTVSFLLMPKPSMPHPAAAEKFEVPTAQEGRAIPVLFGTRRIKGANVAWDGHVKTVAIKSKGGKK